MKKKLLIGSSLLLIAFAVTMFFSRVSEENGVSAKPVKRKERISRVGSISL